MLLAGTITGKLKKQLSLNWDMFIYQRNAFKRTAYGETDSYNRHVRGNGFYDIKGIVEELLDVLRIKDYRFVPEKDNKVFHPGRTAQIVIAGEYAGLIGEIHPEISEEFETPERTYVGVIEVEPLINNAVMEVEYKQLPKHPAVTRDIAVLVNDEVLAGDIEQTISENGGKILEDIKLFDVYKGKQVPEGHKNVAFYIFQG